MNPLYVSRDLFVLARYEENKKLFRVVASSYRSPLLPLTLNTLECSGDFVVQIGEKPRSIFGPRTKLSENRKKLSGSCFVNK